MVKSYLSKAYYSILPPNLKRLLRRGESVLWSGKPERIPFVFLSFGLALTGVYICLVLLFVFLTSYFLGVPLFIIFSASLLLLIITLFLILPFFKKMIEWNSFYYVITTKRVILQEGLKHVKLYHLDDVKHLKYDTHNFINSLFGLGDLIIEVKHDDELIVEVLPYLKDVKKAYNELDVAVRNIHSRKNHSK